MGNEVSRSLLNFLGQDSRTIVIGIQQNQNPATLAAFSGSQKKMPAELFVSIQKLIPADPDGSHDVDKMTGGSPLANPAE